MNIQDVYYDFPQLMTEFEKREAYDESIIEKTPPCLWSKVDRIHAAEDDGKGHEDDDDDQPDELELVADGIGKHDFDRRKPAFGWDDAELESIEECAKQSDYDEFLVFRRLRNIMCRRLICPSGAATTSDLVSILRKEMESGVPAPVPQWYKLSTKTDPDSGKKRRFGYRPCASRGCLMTEDMERKFSHCANCKLAIYCSRNCQIKDWHLRHRIVCPNAKKMNDMTSVAASVIDALSIDATCAAIDSSYRIWQGK